MGLRDLRDRLAALPRLTVRFGGADIGVPDTLSRDKVLAVVDACIALETEDRDRQLKSLVDELRSTIEADITRGHKCYRCRKWTTLGTAWCQDCLDEHAEMEARRPKPKPRQPLPSAKRR
jgi:hypothetical protein